MALQDDILAALSSGNFMLAEQLTARARLEAALAAMQNAVLNAGTFTVNVNDWDAVDQFFEYIEAIGYSPINVFELAKDAFNEARLQRDAARLVVLGLIIAKAVVPRVTRPQPPQTDAGASQ